MNRKQLADRAMQLAREYREAIQHLRGANGDISDLEEFDGIRSNYGEDALELLVKFYTEGSPE